MMLLDGELTVARSLDQASRLYESRRDDAVARIAHYFERAKVSPLTPIRKALGLSSNQMVVPRLEQTRDEMLASFKDGNVPNRTALQWLANESPSAGSLDPQEASVELDSAQRRDDPTDPRRE